MKKSVRVRFAPSPTGSLHIGGARTALFNWLFARHHQGSFLLRIEDTDAERSSTEMIDAITQSMTWLGLSWDEGPFLQSDFLERYRNSAGRLLSEGAAYHCFCTAPDPTLEGEAAIQGGCVGGCSDLPDSEAAARKERGETPAVRFRIPSERGAVRFQDSVFGAVEVDARELADFVILRADATPTYHLSVVCDDIEMEISHVIRGADHVSNTSKHILLFEALGGAIPQFAHLPLILGSDRKRLSKRHGAASVLEFRDRGILPTALLNYLALLGWSSGDDREFFTPAELCESFSLERVNKADAVFDLQKLEWMNAKWIGRLEPEDLEGAVRDVLEKADLWEDELAKERRIWFRHVIGLLKPRVRGLHDFADYGRAFFTDDFVYDTEAANKYLKISDPREKQRLVDGLTDLVEAYRNLDDFSLQSTERILRAIAAQKGLKTGQFIGAVRVALTGKGVAPGLFDVLVALGKSKSVERIEQVRLSLK